MRKYIIFGAIATFVLINAYVGMIYFLPDDELDPRAAGWLEKAPAIPIEQNSHYLIWGLEAPVDVPMREYGETRVAEIVQAQSKRGDKNSASTTNRDAEGGDAENKIEATGMSELCEMSSAYCLDDYRSGLADLLEQGNNRLLEQRYQTLITLQHYQVVEQLFLDTPFPSFMLLMDAQRLYLARIASYYMHGQERQALDALAADLRFARMLMTESDMIITKMVAVKMAANCLQLYAQLLETPTAGMVVEEVKAIAPLNRQEHDITRALKGEYRLLQNVMENLEYETSGSDETVFAYFTGKRPPIRTNRLLNHNYEYFASVAALSRMTPVQFHQGVMEFSNESYLKPDTWDYLVDPVTSIINGIGSPKFINYLYNLFDLDGLIRLVKLKGELIQASVPSDELESFISRSKYATAYGEGVSPIRWDPALQVIHYKPLHDRESNYLYQVPYRFQKDKKEPAMNEL